MKRFAALMIALLLLTGCQKSAPPVSREQVTVPGVLAYQPTEPHKQALALVGKGDLAGAEALLKQVVANQPRAAEAWNDLSFVQAQLNHWPDAVQSARKALEVNPAFAYAEYNLGWALLHTNEWKSAGQYLATSAELQPDRPEPLYALGMWHSMSGSAVEAAERYRQAAAMGYQPAQEKLDGIAANQAQQQEAEAAVAAFPNVPPKVIRDIFDAYVPAGTHRRVDQLVSLVPITGGERAWAALILQQDAKTREYYVQMQREGNQRGTYLGKCGLALTDVPAGGVKLQVFPVAGGQHLLVTFSGGAFICGLKDGYATGLFHSEKPVAAAAGGISVAGEAYRFVPEVTAYLPGGRAEQLNSFLSEIRGAQYQVESGSAIWAEASLGGQSGLALAWSGGVAFKPEGKPARVYLFTQGGQRMVMYPYPLRIGAVTVPGHTLLAVTTHQPGGPNGADIIVLETDPKDGTLRLVFHATGDGTSFDQDRVYTAFKAYRPEGGFDAYQTEYKWDEGAQTFVKGATVKTGQ